MALPPATTNNTGIIKQASAAKIVALCMIKKSGRCEFWADQRSDQLGIETVAFLNRVQ